MGADGHYLPGAHVLERGIFRGRVRYVLPATVVRDDGEVVALWLRPGTPFARPVHPDGSLARIPLGPWTMERREWADTNVVMLTRWDRAHSLWHFFGEDWSFLGWYVNLQAPYARDRLGFTTCDHALDIWAPAPAGEPEWKDEEEFAEACALGLWDEPAVRAEAEHVWHDRPWPTGLEKWRPDPAWTDTPQLTGDWET